MIPCCENTSNPVPAFLFFCVSKKVSEAISSRELTLTCQLLARELVSFNITFHTFFPTGGCMGSGDKAFVREFYCHPVELAKRKTATTRHANINQLACQGQLVIPRTFYLSTLHDYPVVANSLLIGQYFVTWISKN